MWFYIDYSSHVPIYQQIKEKIKEMIAKGEIKEGDFVPSIRVLAKDIGVNVNTIARAYRELAMEGVLKVVRGEGYIVISVDKATFINKYIETLRKILGKLKEYNVSKKDVIKVVEEVFGRGEDDS
ncbi:MAG: GntR family transcriptional regulator [Thermotogaceae bacterium]|nr:GntR family transcriptional regulator [Thermotogaceae bacterium]